MSEMETEPLATQPSRSAARTSAVDTEPLPPPPVPVFAGLTGAVDSEQLENYASTLAASGVLGGERITLAYPGPDTNRTPLDDGVDLICYPLPSEGAATPWAYVTAAQSALLALSAEEHPQATVLLHPDLLTRAPETLMRLAGPVLARQADLVTSVYTHGPFDLLLNNSILAPLTRALYGKRVRFPLSPDFAVSPRLAARLFMSAKAGGSNNSILWPTITAASLDANVAEVGLDVPYPHTATDVELSDAIQQLVGSAFAEMELHAPLWQRVRAPQLPPHRGSVGMPAVPVSTRETEIDTAPMVNSFLLGSRSLREVWGYILPPVTLLDLKRLTLLSPQTFRMPDELWVRIVYDFALGYRLRTLNRTHLLGAITPLYLGWFASFVNEAAGNPAFDANARVERLARAFEDGKPYLVRRWRWPDSFNP